MQSLTHHHQQIVFFHLCLVWTMLLCPPEQIAAQEHFSKISLEQGLSQSQVYHMLQDRRGFIWVATRHGVYRYDGALFTRFSSEDGLIHNTVRHQSRAARRAALEFAPATAKKTYLLNFAT